MATSETEQVNHARDTNLVHSTDDLDSGGYVIGDDMVFPKATIDPTLILLQKEVVEIVTTVIVTIEKEFWELIQAESPENFDILFDNTVTMVEMISESLNNFFDKLYFYIQDRDFTENTKNLIDFIENMSSYSKINTNCLLEIIFKITVDVHTDILRDQLSDVNFESYVQTILNQINLYFQQNDILQNLSHDCVALNHPKSRPKLEKGTRVFKMTLNSS